MVQGLTYGDISRTICRSWKRTRLKRRVHKSRLLPLEDGFYMEDFLGGGKLYWVGIFGNWVEELVGGTTAGAGSFEKCCKMLSERLLSQEEWPYKDWMGSWGLVDEYGLVWIELVEEALFRACKASGNSKYSSTRLRRTG